VLNIYIFTAKLCPNCNNILLDACASILIVEKKKEATVLYYAIYMYLSAILNKGNNKITELRAILQRESQNS
jgi:hypothetical protein